MDGKIAFVVDTNFIFQHPDLDRVLSELDEKYVSYVTQVSVEERIAQQCRDIKNKFDRFESVKGEYQGIASLNLITTYEEKALNIRKRLQAKYNRTFPDRIIPLLRDEDTYRSVLERAFMKIPPFLALDTSDDKKGGKSPSDKGFKDSIMWISMLQYFKNNGPDKVVFLSDDKGFRNQTKELTSEFQEVTGKVIEIMDLSQFKTLKAIEKDVRQANSPKNNEPLPDVQVLRERIRDVVRDVCYFETLGYWGEEQWERYFTLHRRFTATDTEQVFNSLDSLLEERLFDHNIPASDVFGIEQYVLTEHYGIPNTKLEEVSRLYHDIVKKYPQFLKQFYEATANIINENYVEIVVTPDDVPF